MNWMSIKFPHKDEKLNVCVCSLNSHKHLDVAFIHCCLVECCAVQWMYTQISGLLQAVEPSGAELSLASINCLSVSHLLSQTENLTPSSTLSSNHRVFFALMLTVKEKVSCTKLRKASAIPPTCTMDFSHRFALEGASKRVFSNLDRLQLPAKSLQAAERSITLQPTN